LSILIKHSVIVHLYCLWRNTERNCS